MMKRRKVGNLLGLAVLSVVLERPMHPYEMATVLKERGKDADMPIKWGSLYTVVANLEKYGFIEAVESVKDGGRPERTVYRITPAGREEYEDWVRELVGTVETEPPRFRSGLSMLGILGPDQAISLLRQRVAQLDERAAKQQTGLDQLRPLMPRMFLVEVEYDIAMTEAEARWVRGFLEELTSGALPGIEAWRRWYETGELPDDFGEFVEER
ncbi:PadR family transcriptional regulator [Amycolatopsis mediterranei S699]|uniref:PadR family transcriptional regulator n=2 Tax=Amycolatopsis mediterranei TaxID=33910 RepID=A0A0H3CX67_AMYMU|nr:PadR family transcriptional regulator [Amycolatopsis mediterranei U32]AFO73636.1 PadR family transcriptional regulator [Amycolatopsis mediterranei S699]AGT80765.1 PadR family transcriptional regulator [Amycolatopsis mediterranei RB]